MNDFVQLASEQQTVSIYDLDGLDQVRKQLRCDPGILRRLRIDFLKNSLPAEECIARAPESVQEELRSKISFGVLRHKERFDSQIDGASKLVLSTSSGFAIESVILRAGTGRVALCVSSQVGCAAACEFCATGRMGIARDLSAEEIVDQVAQANLLLKSEERRVRNIVFMGMGEPLHNMQQVHDAIKLLTSSEMFNHPPGRILVSTVGIPDRLIESVKQFPEVNHAISLHSASQATRETIIPLAKRYPLDQLRDAVIKINAIQSDKTSVMIEYLMLDQINDSDQDALALLEWTEGLRVHINLIPYNYVAEAKRLRASPRDRIEAFGALLKASGTPTTIRYSMGRDIDAACGQLVKNENQKIARAISTQNIVES